MQQTHLSSLNRSTHGQGGAS